MNPIQVLVSLGHFALAKTRAVLTGAFDTTPLYCRALAGESDYNICVNADLTVSCNCQDFDGTGHIGSLRTQTLSEVFSGPIVNRFQSELASHKHPIAACRACPEVSPIPAARRGAGPAPGAPPTKGLMVENTTLCNLRCGLCRREELLAGRSQHSMSPEDVEIVADMIADNGIELISYYNLGEPFLSPRILDEVATLREKNPGLSIVVSTNGVLMDTNDKISAAMMMNHVYFSIDGVSQETLERYQVNGDFNRSFENMRRLVERRAETLADDPTATVPVIEWKYVLFRWNEDPNHIDRAIELAEAAGVDRLVFYAGAIERKHRTLRFYSDPYFTAAVERSEGGVVAQLRSGRERQAG